jgi:hypothetical protein
MAIAIFIKRVFLVAAISQALWLTACEEFRQFLSLDESGTSVKTVFIQNIPPSIKISQDAKAFVMAESHDNPAVSFRQEDQDIYIETDGLYIMSVFFLATDDDELKGYISDSKKIPDDVTKHGLAFALVKISSGTAKGRIISLSSDINEFGYYWEGGDNNNDYGISTLLITPDARFILQADFFLGPVSVLPGSPPKITYKGYKGTLPEYKLNFGEIGIDIDDNDPELEWGNGGQTDIRLKVFEGYGINPPSNPSLPSKMLTDNFVNDVMDRFS